MAKSARNEMRKVTAAYLNGIGLAILAAGAITPTLADRSFPRFTAVLATGACIAASLALHLVARLTAGRVED